MGCNMHQEAARTDSSAWAGPGCFLPWALGAGRGCAHNTQTIWLQLQQLAQPARWEAASTDQGQKLRNVLGRAKLSRQLVFSQPARGQAELGQVSEAWDCSHLSLLGP